MIHGVNCLERAIYRYKKKNAESPGHGRKGVQQDKVSIPIYYLHLAKLAGRVQPTVQAQ